MYSVFRKLKGHLQQYHQCVISMFRIMTWIKSTEVVDISFKFEFFRIHFLSQWEILHLSIIFEKLVLLYEYMNKYPFFHLFLVLFVLSHRCDVHLLLTSRTNFANFWIFVIHRFTLKFCNIPLLSSDDKRHVILQWNVNHPGLYWVKSCVLPPGCIASNLHLPSSHMQHQIFTTQRISDSLLLTVNRTLCVMYHVPIIRDPRPVTKKDIWVSCTNHLGLVTTTGHMGVMHQSVGTDHKNRKKQDTWVSSTNH